jgi:hypothetical protein
MNLILTQDEPGQEVQRNTSSFYGFLSFPIYESLRLNAKETFIGEINLQIDLSSTFLDYLYLISKDGGKISWKSEANI